MRCFALEGGVLARELPLGGAGGGVKSGRSAVLITRAVMPSTSVLSSGGANLAFRAMSASPMLRSSLPVARRLRPRFQSVSFRFPGPASAGTLYLVVFFADSFAVIQPGIAPSSAPFAHA